MATEKVENELALAQRAGQGLMGVAQQREIAEVQSKLIVARMNARDKIKAQDRILAECTRVSLAEKALYSYARGGSEITGESIRLAEVMAQNWGNFEFGIRELDQRDGESTVEAYAWDLETNVSQRKTFQVPHLRYTKSKGNVKLSDPRDVYEMVANQGARRMRACILGVIPGDVREAAVKQCEETLNNKVKITPELIQSLLTKFSEFNVSKEMIEKRIQRHIEAITPGHVFHLGKIYNSLKDGMSGSDEWFDTISISKAEGEHGTLDVSDLKPKGDGKESSTKPQVAPVSKPKETSGGKSDRPATATEPAGNPNYAETEPDPFKPGGDLFGREPGQEG